FYLLKILPRINILFLCNDRVRFLVDLISSLIVAQHFGLATAGGACSYDSSSSCDHRRKKQSPKFTVAIASPALLFIFFLCDKDDFFPFFSADCFFKSADLLQFFIGQVGNIVLFLFFHVITFYVFREAQTSFIRKKRST